MRHVPIIMEMGATEKINRLCDFYGHELYRRLTHLQTMSFKAWSEVDHWQLYGRGQVITKSNANKITIRETGVWAQDHAQKKQYQFSNTWLYEFFDEYVEVSHLRLGHKQPVALCRLIEQKADFWVSVMPHYCGEDRYAVSIDLSHRAQLISHWKISGKKAEQKQIVYKS